MSFPLDVEKAAHDGVPLRGAKDNQHSKSPYATHHQKTRTLVHKVGQRVNNALACIAMKLRVTDCNLNLGSLVANKKPAHDDRVHCIRVWAGNVK